jgi:perosamine synthetase
MNKKIKLTQVDFEFSNHSKKNLNKVINSGWVTEGEMSKKLIDKFSEITNVDKENIFLTPNCTLGIFLSLITILDKNPELKGKKILVPSFTFYGSVAPIVRAGFVPKFVDVSKFSCNSKLEDFQANIDKDVVGILQVHLFGISMDRKKIKKFAKKNKLFLIEDAAQGLGVKDDLGHTGNTGDFSIFSLYADKIVGCGEGGVVLVNNKKYRNQFKLNRNQGRSNSGTFIHDSLGMNFRMTDLQSGLALGQIQNLEKEVKDRIRRVKKLNKIFSDTNKFYTIFRNPNNYQSTFSPFRYVIIFNNLKSKKIFSECLIENGIMVRDGFWPMHKQKSFKRYSKNIKLKNSEFLGKNTILLPVHKKVDMHFNLLEKSFELFKKRQ